MSVDNAFEMKTSKIGLAKLGSRTVLTPKGPITNQNIEALEAMLNDCISQNKNEIILDCKAISFMDSKALEFFLRMQGSLKGRGGMLKFINVNSICRDIFICTRLINILHIHEDIHEAIRSGL